MLLSLSQTASTPKTYFKYAQVCSVKTVCKMLFTKMWNTWRNNAINNLDSLVRKFPSRSLPLRSALATAVNGLRVSCVNSTGSQNHLIPMVTSQRWVSIIYNLKSNEFDAIYPQIIANSSKNLCLWLYITNWLQGLWSKFCYKYIILRETYQTIKIEPDFSVNIHFQ